MPVVVMPFWVIEIRGEVMLRVPPATTQFVAVVQLVLLPPIMKVMLESTPIVPSFPKSMLLARDVAGTANESNANKTTRLMFLLLLQIVSGSLPSLAQ